MDRIRIYLDMDGVICDYQKAYENNKHKLTYPQSELGFFSNLEFLEDAEESFRYLESKYDVWILTRPSFKNIHCYSEKIKWIVNNLGEHMVEKTIISPVKNIISHGEFLIDDTTNAGQLEFQGIFIHFKDWKTTIEQLESYMKEKTIKEQCCDIPNIINVKIDKENELKCTNCNKTYNI